MKLEGYRHLSENGWNALIHEAWGQPLFAAMVDGTATEPLDTVGRGRLLVYTNDDRRAIIRRYLRGGVIRHFVKESYFLSNRSLRELIVLTRLRAMGLHVPIPVGAAWRRTGPWFRGVLATVELPGEPLVDRAQSGSRVDDNLLREAGRHIRTMHDAGAYHADLNVRNILISDDDVSLIDFDNTCIGDRLTPIARARNLLRLRRSFDKTGLSRRLFAVLREGYGPLTVPPWLDWLYATKGILSDKLSGRSPAP